MIAPRFLRCFQVCTPYVVGCIRKIVHIICHSLGNVQHVEHPISNVCLILPRVLINSSYALRIGCYCVRKYVVCGKSRMSYGLKNWKCNISFFITIRNNKSYYKRFKTKTSNNTWKHTQPTKPTMNTKTQHHKHEHTTTHKQCKQ